MSKIYNISKGQLITLWVFVIIIWIIAVMVTKNDADSFRNFGYHIVDNSGAWGLLFVLIGVPFIMIFYSIGWKNNKKKIKGN